MTSSNVTTVRHRVSASDRHDRFGHSGGVIWLTGLSASGKSTLAMELERHLLRLGYACYTLDGDNIRQGLNGDLGFSPEDRAGNIRRIGEVAALFADAGFICVAAFISPYQGDRLRARAAARRTAFHEIFVSADLATCERRDPKGLYRKARSGELRDFTGVDAPYEAPISPDLTVDTGGVSVAESLDVLARYVMAQFPIDRS